jgi:outer membrane lipase/esterase
MPGDGCKRIGSAGARCSRAGVVGRNHSPRALIGLVLGLAWGLAAPASAQDAVSPTQTPAQRDMASAIDVMCPQLPTGAGVSAQVTQLKQVCGNLKTNKFGYTQPQLNAAIQTLNGEELQVPQQRIQDIRGAQIGIISARLSAIRAGRVGTGLKVAWLDARPQDRAFALDEPQSYDVVPAQFAEDGFLSRLGLFVTGNGSFGDKNSTGEVPGFDFHTEGLTVGADYRVSNTLVAGASVGYMRFDSDFKNSAVSPSGQNLDSNGVQLSLFGTYYPTDQLFIDGIASVGWSFYDATRHVLVPTTPTATGVDEKLNGDFDAFNYGFATNVGYQLQWSGANLTPIVRAEYLRSDIDGFTEDGSSAVKLKFGDQTAESLTTNIGLEADYPISTSFGVISPNARAEYVHEFLGDDNGVKVQYAFDPTNTSEFRVTTEDPDRDYGIVGAGVAATLAGGWGAFLDWSTVVGLSNFSIYTFNLGFRKEF